VNGVISKFALITGASRGIGRSVARTLAHEGLHVIISGRNEKALGELKHEIDSDGGACTYFVADLGKPEEIDKLTGLVAEKTGSLDLLIHSAGIARVGKVADLMLQDWNDSLSINLTAPFYLTRRCLPNLRRNALIIFINSVAAKNSFPDWAAYSAAKAGLAAFADVLRKEVQDLGIKVTSVFSASVNTPMQDSLPYKWDRSRMLTPDQIAQIVLDCYRQAGKVMLKNVDIENIAGTF
jgi:3-oxoacyl-[acyl-carrier protein] reductase